VAAKILSAELGEKREKRKKRGEEEHMGEALCSGEKKRGGGGPLL